MIVFFVLAGASLDLSAIADLGIVGVTFIICRVLGKYLGAFLGGQASGASLQEKRWLGLAMLTQAGVPVGMALVAANQFPEYRQVLLSIVISSTVIFELVGPVLTRIALQKASEKGRLG
jgi:Kef-type K+ transport system membrane component KefB